MKLLARNVILFLMLLSVGSIGVSYEKGVRQGLDTRITWGMAHDAYSMTVAFSRLLFGFHKGYIGYNAVTQILSAGLSPLGDTPDAVALLHSPVAIQKTFDDVQKIDPATLPVYKTAKDANFRSIWGEDLGLSDFYTIAFAIFGYHPDAMYQCFFLVMGLSILIFIASYRRQIAPMASLALACCTFSIFMFSDFFTAPPLGTALMPALIPALIPSVNANRFMSTLGFIPILHMLWAFQNTKLPSRAAIACIVLQALIFAFAVSIRRTALWQLIWLIAVAAIVAWPIWRSQAKRYSKAALRRLFHYPPLRGMYLFLSVIILYQALQTAMLNPIYFSDCAISHHPTWHNIFIGMNENPDWEKYNPEKGSTGDDIAFKSLQDYFHGDTTQYICPGTGMIKMGTHEQMMRKLALKFIAAHPLFTMETFLYYKPLLALRVSESALSTIHMHFLLFLVAMSIVAGVFTAWYEKRAQATIPYRYAAIGLLGFMAALLPSLIFAARLSPDVLWMIVLNFCLLIYFATAALSQRLMSPK